MAETNNNAKLLEQYRKEKGAAMKGRQIRIQSWSDNERLYNGIPQITLLTRSNLHIPKVFEGVQTMSSKIGQLPQTSFKTKPEGDDNAPEIMKALFEEDIQESGGETLWQNSKVEGGIYGRWMYKLTPSNQGVKIALTDTMAFLINPTAKSHKDALYEGEQFIYKTIEEIEAEAEAFGYDLKEIQRIKDNKAAKETAPENSQEKSLKDLRMTYLGYANVTQLGANMLELTEWYTHIKGKKHVMTVADDVYLLRCIPIKEVGLPDTFPYRGGAIFPRGVAFWTPGVADILRDPNLAMDVSINQLIDNNTYRNFGMLFVSSSSGLKQSSLTPRPLGVTAVNVPIGSNIKDHVMPYNPPEINDAAQTMAMLNQIAERAVGLSGMPMGHKGKQSVTQNAEQNALIESKTNLIKQNFIESWEEVAQLYTEIVKQYLTSPRKVKVFGFKEVTLEGVTKANFKDVDFIAHSQSPDVSDSNKAIKQKAAIELYTLFKDDPKIPGQKWLRERTAKVFELDPTDIDKLFSEPKPTEGPQMPAAQPQEVQQPQSGMPSNPGMSQTATAAQAQVPPSIR